jgi:hypothetical protein
MASFWRENQVVQTPKKKKKNLKECSWFEEPKGKPGSKVACFSFFVLFHYFLLALLLKFCESERNAMD